MSTLTGTVRDASGNPLIVDGKVWFEISQNANVISGGGCGGPYAISPGIPNVFTLLDGVIQGSPTIPGQSCISPSNTYYKMSVVTDDGVLVLRRNVVVDGASVDIGTLAAPVLPGQTGIPGPQGPPMTIQDDGNTVTARSKLDFMTPVETVDDQSNDRTRIFLALAVANDGGAIVKQGSSPGTQQASANFNISGTGVFGGNVSPTGNITGSPALVASKIDLGTRSMSGAPTADQIHNRLAIDLAATGSFGLDVANPGKLIRLSLTGATSYTHLIDIDHQNTSATGDSSAIYIRTNSSFSDAAAAVSLRNIGVSDALYIGAEGPAGGTGSGALGIGLDVNRQFGTNNPNSDRNCIGILGINWGDNSNVGTIIQMSNFDATCLSPLMVGQSNGAFFTASASTAAGDSNNAFAIVDSVPAVKASCTYGGQFTGTRFIGPATKLRSATTDVAVDGDTPAAGELLVATSTTATVWQKLDTTTDAGAVIKQASYPGTQQTGNINVSGAARFAGQYRASVYLSSATQSITTATPTAVAFNGELVDVGTMHDNVTNNSRLTIPTGGDGTYVLNCGVNFAFNATGIRQVEFFKNGATILAFANAQAITSGTNLTRLNLAHTVDLVATDYIEVRVYQDSGGNLNINGSNAYDTWCTATKVN